MAKTPPWPWPLHPHVCHATAQVEYAHFPPLSAAFGAFSTLKVIEGLPDGQVEELCFKAEVSTMGGELSELIQFNK